MYNKQIRKFNKTNDLKISKRRARINYDNFYKLILSMILIFFVVLNFRLEIRPNEYIESEDTYGTVIEIKLK